MSQILFFIALGVYVVAAIGFLGHILFRTHRLIAISFWLAVVGFLLHSGALIASLPGRAYPFILSNSDAYALIAWTVILLFIIFARFFMIKGTGAFFMLAAASMMILTLFGAQNQIYQVSIPAEPWVLVHLLFAFAAFAVFVVSFVTGIAYILQEYRIKAKHLGHAVRRLPPLEVLDRVHFKALGLGMILLTAAMIIGALMNKWTHGVFFSWDLKQLWVVFIWFLYVVFLELRNRIGWRGRRGIILSVLGFLIVIVAFFGIQHRPMQ